MKRKKKSKLVKLSHKTHALQAQINSLYAQFNDEISGRVDNNSIKLNGLVCDMKVCKGDIKMYKNEIF